MKIKRMLAAALAAAMLLALATACGGQTDEVSADADADTGEEQTVQSKLPALDLTAFYNDLAVQYGFSGDVMADLTEDPQLLEDYYPGLAALDLKQMVIHVPVMSSEVNEIALIECADAAAADAAEQILRDRATAQVEGNAMYAEPLEAWSNSAVMRQENYLALIASAAHQMEIEDAFSGAFAAE